MQNNPIKPTLTVMLAGEEIPLRYEHRDFAAAEFAAKLPLIGPGAAEFWSGEMPAFQIGILLYAGIHHAKPKLTLDQVQALITFENCGEIQDALIPAIAAAMPQKSEGGAREPDPTPASPTGGSTFGASPESVSD